MVLAGVLRPLRPWVTFLCLAKEKLPKERRTRMARPPPRSRGVGLPALSDATSCRGGSGADFPVCARFAALAQHLAVLGRAIRDPTAKPRQRYVSRPVAAARASQPATGKSRVPCSSPRHVVCARRVGRAPRPARRAGRGRWLSGERFFGTVLVATRKVLAFGCENPIKTIVAGGDSTKEEPLPATASSHNADCRAGK